MRLGGIERPARNHSACGQQSRDDVFNPDSHWFQDQCYFHNTPKGSDPSTRRLGGMLMEEGEVFSKEHGESLGCRVQNVENCSINCGWLELLSCLIAQRLCSFPIHTLKKRCVPLSQPQSTFNMTLQLPQGAFHPMWIGSGRWSHGTQLQKKLRVMLHPFNTWRKPTVLKELAGPRAKPVLFQLDNL